MSSDFSGADKRRLKVFISYSRNDAAFADELLAGLELLGFAAFLDRHDIVPGEPWETRLERLIEIADTVVFVVSPDSVGSERCAWEIERALAHKKRLLPIVWRRVDDDQVPQRLKQLNYIFFDRPMLSLPALSSLGTALRTDIEWIREHTRIGEAALRWAARDRSEALLLRGEELNTAREWLLTQPQFANEPTLLHHEYIQAGVDAEAARSLAERQRLDAFRQALDSESLALRRAQRAVGRAKLALLVASGLFAFLAAGTTTWYYQSEIVELYRWHVVMAPTVLSAQQEAKLAATPGGAFVECAKGCPTMIVLPAGALLMGSPEAEFDRMVDEGPQHQVSIRSFAVSKFEVTFAEWDECVAANACAAASDRGWGRSSRPVIFVNWQDAKQYAAWLSRITGSDYRLLSEAEWEYAARALQPPQSSRFDTPPDLGAIAWYGNKDGSTMPVGGKAANAFGLHDMHGNVWEWVEDCWNESYADKPEELKQSGDAWTSGDCSRHVVRGGAWNSQPKNLRAADRNRVSIGLRIGDLGIRLARSFGG